jgi:hypothetical protein
MDSAGIARALANKKTRLEYPVGFLAARQSCEPPSCPDDFTNLFEANNEYHYLTGPNGMSMKIPAEGKRKSLQRGD